MFVVVIGPVGCSFHDYGFNSYNYLSSVKLKPRLTVIIIPLHAANIISHEPPTTPPGNTFRETIQIQWH